VDNANGNIEGEWPKSLACWLRKVVLSPIRKAINTVQNQFSVDICVDMKKGGLFEPA
jgi:hypothetical protein